MYYNGRHDELEPRSVPKPTQFQEISAKPEVPELSVVFDSSVNISKPSNSNPSYATSQTTQETYTEWKNRQNHSPVHKETRYYEPRNKTYQGSSSCSEYDQNPYSRFSDRVSYKSNSEYHKCSCQNTPTVKDIYNMMQIQNDQIKFLLDTIQKLLVTILSNQQNQYKCCCFKNNQCKKDNDYKTSELIKNVNDTQEGCQLQHSDNNIGKTQIDLEINDIVQKKNEQTISKCSNKQNIKSVTTDKPKILKVSKHNKSNNATINIKEKERTYSVASDESFDLNANDVQVIEAPISPEQSIHIEMKSSSEDSSNSECEEESNKKIEVGWTMYKNIIGQVNNLLEDNKNELNSAKPVESIKTTPIMTKPRHFEPYKHFILPENNKIDSSLQMQALAMQYLSPEQAGKFDINKHIPTPPTVKSPNNYSISTLHYMERYHLIGSEPNCTLENPQYKLPSNDSLNKKKKSSHKNKTPSKVLNITELKQQPKLS